MNRLGLFGLIFCYDLEGDISLLLRKMYRGREFRLWEGCLFSATDFGEELVGKFPLAYGEWVSPGFRDGLEFVFNEYGVRLGYEPALR